MLYSILICITYILGIIWGLTYDKVGLVPIFLILIVLLMILKNKKFYYLIFIFILLFGAIYFHYKFHDFSNKYNSGNLIGNGEIIKQLSNGESFNKYLFKIKNGDKFLLYIPNSVKIKENDVINFEGVLKKPTDARNIGGFSYANYLYSKSIYGSIYIYNTNGIEIVDNNVNLISIIRNHIINSISKVLPKQELGVLLGITIGDKNFLSDEVNNVFREARNIAFVGGFWNACYICYFIFIIYYK